MSDDNTTRATMCLKPHRYDVGKCGWPTCGCADNPEDIVARLHEACIGHPAARIAWPHRLLHDTVAEIEQLRRIETAARNVAETLNGGFLVCQRCGDQETTTDLDYARDLYAALGMEQRK